MNIPAAPPAMAPETKVELSFSALNLANMDTFSKSDPILIVYLQDTKGSWVEYGRTEWIKDNLNPKWVKKLQIQYKFEEVQSLKFLVYDIDDPKAGLEKQDLIGETTAKLSEIVTAREGRLTKELSNRDHPNSRRGSLVVQSEEVRELKYSVTLLLAGKHLDKKDLFGKSDPFVVISRSAEGGHWIPAVQTEVIKNTLDPVWKSITCSIQTICNGDYDRPLLFECFDWNRSGKHEIIGTFQVTLRQLQTNGTKDYELINASKQKKKGSSYKNSGVIQVLQIDIQKEYSFLDYIAGGCQISLVIAIDFTASNGDPRKRGTLHFFDKDQPNEYVRAIMAVGEILASYDSDQMFPVYGFGAKIPPNFEVSHCFPCNFNWSNAEVPGMAGVVAAYQQALQQITLHGPTHFAPILKTACDIASKGVTQADQHFYILLILTDGAINDMDQTIDQIVHAANNLPLAIVIVGVGSADFTNMNILDADDNPLKNNRGEVMQRDIVQFVEYRKYQNAPPGLLAKETLAEVPGQLLSFMRSRRITPNPSRVGIAHPAAAAAQPMPAPMMQPQGSAIGMHPMQQGGQPMPMANPYNTNPAMMQPQGSFVGMQPGQHPGMPMAAMVGAYGNPQQMPQGQMPPQGMQMMPPGMMMQPGMPMGMMPMGYMPQPGMQQQGAQPGQPGQANAGQAGQQPPQGGQPGMQPAQGGQQGMPPGFMPQMGFYNPYMYAPQQMMYMPQPGSGPQMYGYYAPQQQQPQAGAPPPQSSQHPN